MSSAEESDDEPPACCFFQAADPPQASELLAYNPDHHFDMPLEEEAEEAPAAHNATHDWSAVSNTSRGGYSRDGAAKRGSHADQAHGFWETVSSTALAGACKPGCAVDCTGRVSRNEMLTCIAASYGTVTFTSDEQLKIEKRRPGNSYGKNIQHDGEAGRWMCTTKSRETGDGWAQLFDSFVAFLPDGSAATTYRVAGHQTCANFTRCAYGIPETTWLHGLAAARRQPGGAVIARQQSYAGQSTAGVDRQETVSSTSEAIGWWVDLFAEWDKLPNESPPVIKYPPYVGEALYSEVYVPEMELYSMAPPLKQNDGKAPGSWFRAREAAVLEFSLTEFGLKEGTATGGPFPYPLSFPPRTVSGMPRLICRHRCQVSRSTASGSLSEQTIPTSRNATPAVVTARKRNRTSSIARRVSAETQHQQSRLPIYGRSRKSAM